MTAPSLPQGMHAKFTASIVAGDSDPVFIEFAYDETNEGHYPRLSMDEADLSSDDLRSIADWCEAVCKMLDGG